MDGPTMGLAPPPPLPVPVELLRDMMSTSQLGTPGELAVSGLGPHTLREADHWSVQKALNVGVTLESLRDEDYVQVAALLERELVYLSDMLGDIWNRWPVQARALFTAAIGQTPEEFEQSMTELENRNANPR